MSGHSSDSANPTNHGKRYTLLLDDWPRQGAAGGVASNFRHVANALHQRGQLYSVWIIDEHRPFWWPDTLEPDVPYRVVRINCNWGKYCRGGGRLGRTLVAVIKIAIQLTQEHAFFDRVVATNYYGFAGLYMHLPWAHQTMTRISTTTEQTNNYKTDSGPRLTNLTGRLFAAWEYRTIRNSQLLTSHTVQHIKWLANRLKIPMKRFAYVPHGIPIERLAAVPWVPPRTLIFLGRLEHRKGCDVLIKALPELLAAVPDVRFVMIGRDMGDYESQLDLNFRTQYADRLIFTGLVSDQERDR